MSNTELSLIDPSTGGVATPSLATTDSLPWQIDATAFLAQVGGTLSSVTTRWTNVSTSGTGQGKTISGPAASVSGSDVNLTAVGSVLSVGTWRLDVIVTTSGGAVDTGSAIVNVAQ